MPPWIWPSTSVGLMARPTSWAATMREHLDGAELDVDLDLGHLRGEAVGGVGDALAVGVERRGRRVEACPRPSQRRSPLARRAGRRGEIDACASASPSAIVRRAPSSDERRVRAGIGERQDLARAGPRPASRAALPETKVWREAEVLPASAVRSVSPTTMRNARGGRPSASAAICSSTVVEPWPMSTAPLKKRERAVARRARCAWSRGWTARCCRSRTTCRRCRRRAGAAARSRCGAATRASAASQSRLQRVEALRQAGGVREHLAGRRGVAVRRARCGGGWPSGRGRACSARSSISVSWAIAACGTPKPRKAPAGVSLV